MKILDKKSVSMTVLSPDIDASSDLAKNEFFGQFGAVQSLRVLQNSEPKEIYLRFDNESSAKQAIAWCLGQPSVFKNAQHGFNKYCITFINHKVCTKEKCENRHSWADTQDILTFAETRVPGVNVPPHGQSKCPLATSPAPNSPDSPAPKGTANANAPANAAASVKSATDNANSTAAAMQVALQSRLIDDLMRELAALQKVNYALKSDVAKLQRSQAEAQAQARAKAMSAMNQMNMDAWMSAAPMACQEMNMNMSMNMKVNVPAPLNMQLPMRPTNVAYSNLRQY